MNETWHLEGLVSHSKKIHIVANSWVQDQQGMYPLFDWYLKLFPIGVCFFATSVHHTSKLFRRSHGHEWVPNKKSRHWEINITLHTPHHYGTVPVPIIQIRWHSCKTSLEALGGRTSTPLAQPIPSKHLPERLKGDFFFKIRKQIDRTNMLTSMTLRFGLFWLQSYWHLKVCSPKFTCAAQF